MKVSFSWLFPIVFFVSSSIFAEAVGDKNGYLRSVSNTQLEQQIHKRLIKEIKIENPQFYTGKEVHQHWRCTKTIKHRHKGSRRHEHKYNCPNKVVAVPMRAMKAAGAPQASTTNLQEQGVDEADFVKTDGRYLFAISNNSGIRIFDTKTNTMQPKQIATLGFEKSINLTGMYLMPKKNRLLLIGQNFRQSFRTSSHWSGSTSLITVDIRNKAKPKVIQHVKIDGHPKTTRRIANKLYLVLSGDSLSFPSTYKYYETAKKMTKAEHAKVWQGMATDIKKWRINSALPHYRVLGKTGVKPLTKSGRFMLNPGDIQNYGLTTLLAIDLNANSFQFDALHYFGYTGTVYASNNALYIAPENAGAINSLHKTRFPKGVENQLIHKFAFSNTKGFDYRGTGAVLGNFGWRGTSSFQLDEDNKGNLRVVTTNWSSRKKYADPAANSPVVLTALAEHPHNKQLVTLSRLPNRNQPKALGKKGEQLYGARLFNDYAYFVTFKQTDPLYVIDMRNPRNMRVVGELEIPGFSDYLHPISQNLLLGVGKKATDDGRVQGLKLSLFDISNPRNPREVHKLPLGERGTNSPANSDHHAFASLKMRNSSITRVSLPIALVTDRETYNTENGLFQFEVNSRSRKIQQVGQILPPSRNKQRWYWNSKDRSIIIGNKLYFYNNGNFWAGSWGQKDKLRRPKQPQKTN